MDNNVGELLKKIRLEHGDSLRSLANKTNIVFSYIDKMERGTRPLNKENLLKYIKVYPLNTKELTQAYVNEVIPNELYSMLKDISNENEHNSDLENIYGNIFESLNIDEQKTILYNILDKYKLILLEKDLYKSNIGIIEQIKEKIDNL